MDNKLEPYVPYLGNKFGILDQIYATIRMLDIVNPRRVIDAFCGGGSFAYFMAMHGYKVLANDLQADIIGLHNAIKTEPELVMSWGKDFVTKDYFDKIKTENTPRSALLKQIFSFGNNGADYFTALSREDFKRKEFYDGVSEPNSRMRHVEDIMLAYTRYKMDIDFITGSYADLELNESDLVYCDPPYANAGGYVTGDFDHDAFYKWALAQKCLVLISEYNMPDGFVLVDEYSKYVESSRAARAKVAVERLYANKPVHKLALF